MELHQFFNEDLQLSQNSNLLLVSGALESQQRLYRRLLTATGKYIWHPGYGAGLPQYVGQNLTPALERRIKGILKTQMFLEEAVERNPEPVISLSQVNNNIVCKINYVYKPLNETYTLSFSVAE